MRHNWLDPNQGDNLTKKLCYLMESNPLKYFFS